MGNINNAERTHLIGLLDNMKKEIERTQGHEHEEIEFECACVDGKYKIVEKMLNEVPYFSEDVEYIISQIAYVEEANKRKSKGRDKVLDILKNKINEIVNNEKNKKEQEKKQIIQQTE